MGIPFCQHWIWSDGCAGQLKNAHVFQWLSLLNIRYKQWHIYGAILRLEMDKERMMVLVDV